MLASVLLEVTTKASLVLVLALGVSGLMATRASAAARHLLWTLVFVTLLSLPALVWFGPAWQVTVPNEWASRTASAFQKSTGASRSLADGEVWPATTGPDSHAPLTREPGHRQFRSDDRHRPSSSLALGALSEWSAILAWVWVSGVALGLVRLLVGLIWAALLARGARVLTAPEWLALHAETMERMGMTRTVSLRMSPRVGVPVACGTVRAAILLPPEADGWGEERRQTVLLHELAHVGRRDCFTQAFSQFVWALHWCNPLVFIAVRQLRTEQERACDDLVLQSGIAAPAYADHLWEIARASRRMTAPSWATLAIARFSRLEARVRAILDSSRRRQPPSRRLRVGLTVIVCACIVPLGALRPAMAVQALTLLPSVAVNAIGPYTPLFEPRLSDLVNAGSTASEPEPEAAAVARVPVSMVSPRPVLNADGEHAFLETYCLTCHNEARKVAGLILDRLDVEQVGDNVEVWERVVRKLQSRLHPPTGSAQPDRASVDAFGASIETALDRVDLANWGPDRVEPLSDAEIALRLSKFLWNSGPDDRLLKLAAQGKLHDPSTLQQQARRMMVDGRSAAWRTGFFNQWLYLGNLAKLRPDPALFPEFDTPLRDALQRETDLFLASQIRDDRPITDLLTANYTFLNDRLARHYGIGGVKGAEFRRITLTDEARAGLLGQGSILAVTSYANRTSPVLRGKFVLEEFLGISPPPPPPNVPALKPDTPDHPLSMRQRMEQHRKNPACASCHITMDSVGFALENFDAIGRWRDTDGPGGIDASGEFPDGTHFDGPSQLRAALLDRRDAMVSTVALKLLAYSLGRPARYADMPAVRAIVREAAPTGHTWSALVVAIVRSQPFQTKRVAP